MESIGTAFAHLMGNYQFQTAAYVAYVYDHALTLGEEVDKIWRQPFTFASLLFYINRYITHCQFIIIQVEFHETTWSQEVSCDHYVKFAGGATLGLVTVAELIMILRVYALYLKNNFVLAFLLTALAVQISVCGWVSKFGVAMPLPNGFPGCVLTGGSKLSAAFWIAPLVTDCCVFLLTLWRSIRYRRTHGRTSTMQIILRDGILYFVIIFSANLMNTIVYFAAVDDLKAIGASFGQIMTALMVARLQLNLRQARSDDGSSLGSGYGDPRMPRAPEMKWDSARNQTSTFLSMGNLGGEIKGSFFESDDEHTVADDAQGIELGEMRRDGDRDHVLVIGGETDADIRIHEAGRGYAKPVE